MLMYSFIFILAIGNGSAQSFERRIALLDLTVQNGEDNDGQLFSAEHILKVTGIPYAITNEPLDAMNYAMIFCSSYLDSKTFTEEEKTGLITYISNGGIIVASRVIDETLNSLFGITAYTESNANYLINWNNTLSTSLFRWIDEPEEWTLSLGREGGGAMFKTVSYELSSAVDLARFENETVAVTQNKFGNGFAYNFGFTWKEVILRSQINRDIEAQRISSNGFEPTMDVIMLLMRAIFNEHIPYSTWKHTSPGNSSSTLMITHDVDGTSGMDTMNVFSESEKNLGITATYNITVRYISDALESAFYIGKDAEIQGLINDGHVIGSHSVGHFPDFWDDDIFPIGNQGNTMANYLPHNDLIITTGGTVYGEMEVSKEVLETDFGIDIRIFRTGHLVYNKYMVEVMHELGYFYNSSYSANEVLTNFPYQNKTGRSFSGTNSNIYELPVSISDVYHADPFSEDNYLEKVDLWLDIISKIDANNASTVLLIHPNREYKLLGQELLIASLPESIAIKEMGVFGDFWRDREEFDFTTDLIGNSLSINIASQYLTLNENPSIIIANGQALDEILIKDEAGYLINYSYGNWETEDIIIYEIGLISGSSEASVSFNNNMSGINIYPNPVTENLYIEMDLIKASNIDIELLDIFGKMITKKESLHQVSGNQIITFNLSELKLAGGLYFCKIKIGENDQIVKKVLIK
jgi:peptidoglycan/xylan/chitin deacetylase (PgdA/CDA1 family)